MTIKIRREVSIFRIKLSFKITLFHFNESLHFYGSFGNKRVEVLLEPIRAVQECFKTHQSYGSYSYLKFEFLEHPPIYKQINNFLFYDMSAVIVICGGFRSDLKKKVPKVDNTKYYKTGKKRIVRSKNKKILYSKFYHVYTST